jgi:hypothetical protein
MVRDMPLLARIRSPRFVSSWIALTLLGIAAALVLLAVADSQLASIMRSGVIRINASEDLQALRDMYADMYQGGVGFAVVGAAISVALAALVVRIPSRLALLASGGFGYVVGSVIGWGGLRAPYDRGFVWIGPVELNMAILGAALVALGTLCFIGFLVGWHAPRPTLMAVGHPQSR